jgi:hypothetical protein
MTYRTEESYGEKALETVLKEYSVESLEADLRYAKEDLAVIKKYLQITDDHLEIVKKTPLRWYVEFRKEHNYSTKHINYYALAFQLPDIPDADKNARRMYPYNPNTDQGTHNKPFLGNEKKAAIEYAVSLSAKYGGCPIIGNAAELIKPQKDVIKI